MQTLAIPKKKRIYALAFSPTGEELAAVCGDGFLRVWDLARGEVRHAAPVAETQSGYDLAYLDSDRLILGGLNLMVWDTTADGWRTFTTGATWGRRIKTTPDGAHLAQVDQTRSTEWAAGEGLLVFATADWELLPQIPLAQHTTGGVAFSRDGRFLTTGHMGAVGERNRSITGFPQLQLTLNEYDYFVHVRSWPGGAVQRTIDGWGQAVTHLAFSPDGRLLAGTAGPRLRVWDLEADREVALHKRGPKHFQGLSFTRDGRFLATVSNDETVRIWDAAVWQEHRTYTWKVGRLLNISFAPDGLRAATGSDRGQIVVWDVE